MIGNTFSSSFMPMCPAQGSVSNSSGKMVLTAIFFLIFDLMIICFVGLFIPNNTSSASSIFPIVAEIPQVLILGNMPRSREIASSICTPRLEPMSSCHSSTMMVVRPSKNPWYALVENSTCMVSGVVIRISGGLRSCFFCVLPCCRK